MVFKYLQSGLISLLSIFLSLKFAGCQVSQISPCKAVWVPQLQLSSCNSVESGYWIRVPDIKSQLDLWKRSSVFPCSFDHPPAPEVFLQELREVRKKNKKVLSFPDLLWKRAAFSSQPYVFRDRAWVHRKSSCFLPRRIEKKDQTELFHDHGLSLSFAVVQLSCSSKFSVPVSWHSC